MKRSNFSVPEGVISESSDWLLSELDVPDLRHIDWTFVTHVLFKRKINVKIDSNFLSFVRGRL